MGVSIERDAVGFEFGNLGHGAINRFRRLLWQTVNQIDINRLKTTFARSMNQIKHLLGGLNAVNGFLNCRFKILHTKTQAIETHFCKRIQSILVDGARINLNGIFAIRDEVEIAAQHAHHLTQLIIGQEGRRSATKMQLGHRLPASHVLDVKFNLTSEVG
jgi:hypothetical protein